MALHFKGETKFPLGGHTYVTIKTRYKQPTIKIQSYKNLKTATGHSVIIPTRCGVMLSTIQFEQLLKNTPLMRSTLESLRQSKRGNKAHTCTEKTVSDIDTADAISEHAEKTLIERDTPIETDVGDSKEIVQSSDTQSPIVEPRPQIENGPQLKKSCGRPSKQRISSQHKRTICGQCDKENIPPIRQNQSKSVLRKCINTNILQTNVSA